MNGAHLHLVLNHLPVLLAPVGLGLGVYAHARRQDDVLRAALGVLVLTAVAAFAANWTGAGAEHVLEAAVPSVSEDAIHAHEAWADRSSLAAYLLGALALGTLVLSRASGPRRPLVLATLAVALGVTGLMAYTATLGGEIRHTEILASAASASVSETALPLSRP